MTPDWSRAHPLVCHLVWIPLQYQEHQFALTNDVRRGFRDAQKEVTLELCREGIKGTCGKHRTSAPEIITPPPPTPLTSQDSVLRSCTVRLQCLRDGLDLRPQLRFPWKVDQPGRRVEASEDKPCKRPSNSHLFQELGHFLAALCVLLHLVGLILQGSTIITINWYLYSWYTRTREIDEGKKLLQQKGQ